VFLQLAKGYAEGVLGLKELERLYRTAPHFESPDGFWRWTLESLNISANALGNLNQIKEPGGLIIVSNHPFGLLDGVTLADLVASQRSDYLILGNALLAQFPEIKDRIASLQILSSDEGKKIFGKKDPAKKKHSVARENFKSISRAIEHVKNGGVLILFPAGSVSTAKNMIDPAIDEDWQPTIAKIIEKAQAPVLPVFFHGQNSQAFQLASKAPGSLKELLRVALLPRQALNQRNEDIKIQIGSKIYPERFNTLKALGVLEDDKAVAQHLRAVTYSLSGDPQLIKETSPKDSIFSEADERRKDKPIAEETPPERLKQIINQQLKDGKMKTLVDKENSQVLFISGQDIDQELLHQIGVLREKTFRPEGEGTGQPVDLDEFDKTYGHLFVWNKEDLKIAGAYRIGLLDKAIESGDYSLIYSNFQYNYNPSIFRKLGSGVIELGRSFVTPEYQKSNALKLLWSGISEFLYANPKYRYMIGPVSISGDYSPLAQTLMFEYLMKYHGIDESLRDGVSPTVGFPQKVELPREQLEKFLQESSELSDFDQAIESLEGKKIPSLVKYYSKIVNAQFLSFDFDPAFNTLDGLIVVKVGEMPEPMLRRFLGDSIRAQEMIQRYKEGSDSF